MRSRTGSLKCPLCAHPASITLFAKVDPRRGSEGHALVLQCSNPREHRPLTEHELLRIWAAQRARHMELADPPHVSLTRHDSLLQPTQNGVGARTPASSRT